MPLLAAVPIHGGVSNEMPRLVRGANRDSPPLWVDAAEALTAGGDLRPEYFGPGRQQRIQDVRARNIDGCTSFQTVAPSMPWYGTVEDRVSKAFTVVSGEITSARTGFYAGVPGTLFAVRVTARPKMFGHSAVAKSLYAFVVDADISTPLGHICAAQGAGDAVTPAVGDRVILFAHLPAPDEARQLVKVEPRFGLVIERGNTLLGNVQSKSGVLGSLGEVLRAVEKSPSLREQPSSSR